MKASRSSVSSPRRNASMARCARSAWSLAWVKASVPQLVPRRSQSVLGATTPAWSGVRDTSTGPAPPAAARLHAQTSSADVPPYPPLAELLEAGLHHGCLIHDDFLRTPPAPFCAIPVAKQSDLHWHIDPKQLSGEAC
eukprot:CAMPEP_0180828352 /NCGR_PEP_ID=MMETSP1038_2-20121128/74638_2 /TAXON_ID=632150 /ORGANISM="Azadinium spinosum, Strain 3D9" /LENGTH=137 /DNA_ID=CAMNT_0022871235 /DNA_START=187 /DNA_END=598 /DNA_ORIENTATION=-